MLWRVRTTLDDRPGALAELTTACGSAGVNILGLQVFPGIERVTDELVLRTPDDWDLADLADLVERSGGTRVSVLPCTDAALADQPTRYVVATRGILAEPASFPDVVARLFDAEADVSGAGLEPVMDGMDLEIGDVVVQLRRTAPFTAAEHARGAALAELVADVLAAAAPTPAPRTSPASRSRPSRSARARCGPSLPAPSSAPPRGPSTTSGRGTSSWGSTRPGGVAASGPDCSSRRLAPHAPPTPTRSSCERRRTTRAVLPLVLGTGLRGRIRMGSDDLTVRIPVRRLAGV